MKQALIFLLWLIALTSSAQAETGKRRSVFFELAGSGGLGSLNYESRFAKRKQTEFAWRAGLSFAPIDKNNGTGLVFPVMVHSLSGAGPHKLELGLGQGMTVTTKGHFFLLTTAALGYRYQHVDKRWFYRLTYTPLISYLVDFQVQHWGGASIGYTFNSGKK